MTKTDNIFETRILTPMELAEIVKSQRLERGWTQETLAELAKFQVRTIQRVENGTASSLDTRRALARALAWEDIDTFNKPWPIPNVDMLKKEVERLEQETNSLGLEKTNNGRHLREFVENVEAFCFSQISELSEEAENVFAELQDYLRDYGDVNDCYSATQKIEVNKDIQEKIDVLAKAGFSLGVAQRKLKQAPTASDISKDSGVTVLYVVVGKTDGFPPAIRVPKQVKMGFYPLPQGEENTAALTA